jgi:hypothetical protein
MMDWNSKLMGSTEVWSDIIPQPPGIPALAVAAVSLDGILHIFVVYPLASDVRKLWHNSTRDLTTWTGWLPVERDAVLPGSVHGPLDVAAGIFRNRIYLASRWEFSNTLPRLALNFSADGDNWSGWRQPESDKDFRATATAALAPVNNHLYIFANGSFVTLTDGHEEISEQSLSVY